MSGETMTFPSRWEQFLHDYEFEDEEYENEDVPEQGEQEDQN